MNQRRLLLLTPDFYPNRGGVARYLFKLAEFFSKKITVVTSVVGASQNTNLCVIEHTLLNRMFWPKWLASVRLLFNMNQTYDLVLVSHILPYGTAVYLASLITKKPFIVIVHGMDVRLAASKSIKKIIAKIVFKHARVIVANSQALASEVARIFGVTPIVVYPCLEKMEKMEEKKKIETKVRLLTVSRLVERKGHTKVLTALAELKQSGAIQQFCYDIVGTGPMMQSLKNIADQLNLNEVVFHGEVNDEKLDSLYSSAYIFLMPVFDDPIDKEGFGYVFLEAAKFGVPSVSTNIEGVNEAIINEETGILIDPTDSHALSHAILRLVNDQELQKKLGEQAKQRFEQEFTCERQFIKLEPYL